MSSSNQDTPYDRTLNWFYKRRYLILPFIFCSIVIFVWNFWDATENILSRLNRSPHPIEAGDGKAALPASSERQEGTASPPSPKEHHDQQETETQVSQETNLGVENSTLEQPISTAPQIVEEAALPHYEREANRVTAAEPESPSRQNAPSSTAEAVQQQADGFVFDLKSCSISGTLVKCELTITNEEEDRLLDVNVRFSRLFDEEGNEFRPETASIGGSAARRMVGMTREGPRKGTLLASGVPARTLLIFDGVPEDTSRLTLLEIVTNGPRIQFRNIPLIRD